MRAGRQRHERCSEAPAVRVSGVYSGVHAAIWRRVTRRLVGVRWSQYMDRARECCDYTPGARLRRVRGAGGVTR